MEYDVWGLICFSEPDIADFFIEATGSVDLRPEEVTFEKARKIAQTKVSCLFLMDNPNSVSVHWVK